MLRLHQQTMHGVAVGRLSGASQMAAAALLWDALLTPQRRKSFFYGELAALHPSGGAATAKYTSVSTAPANTEETVPGMQLAMQEVRSLPVTAGVR